MKQFLLSAIIFGFFSHLVAYGQDDNHWERYQCRTPREIIGIHRDSDVFREMQSKKKAMLLTGDDFASQMKLIYLGKERPEGRTGVSDPHGGDFVSSAGGVIQPYRCRRLRFPPFAKCAKDGGTYCIGDASEIKS